MPKHRLDALISPHLERLVAFRRDLHRHPELQYQEHLTAKKVEAALRSAGFVTRRLAGTGVVAETGGGPALALRADMDALPLTEANKLEYVSTFPGKMHACGHDGHTAILLGTALALAETKDRIRGNVRLIFQPAEEGGAGAKRMCEEGALAGVSRIFGLHNLPLLRLGKVGVRRGAMMAATGSFTMNVIGVGGHGSQPQVAKDPILAAAHIVTTAQSLVSRETHPMKPAVVTFGTIEGGTATNIIPGSVTLSGTIRSFDDQQEDHLGARLGELARGVCKAMGLKLVYDYQREYPVTRNHDAEADLVGEVGRELFGQRAVSEVELPTMAGEDFSYFLQERPGAYFVLGSGAKGRTNAMCHSPNFDFNDDLIPLGIRMYLRIVERTLECQLT